MTGKQAMKYALAATVAGTVVAVAVNVYATAGGISPAQIRDMQAGSIDAETGVVGALAVAGVASANLGALTAAGLYLWGVRL